VTGGDGGGRYMRLRLNATVLLAILIAGVCAAAERQWQTGTWTDVGTKRTPWVGDAAARSGPFPGGPTRPPGMTEVGTYVIETADLRLDLEDVVPLGSHGAFERSVTIGAAVTFALSKNIAYIRNADGTEYRLRVIKKRPKPRQSGALLESPLHQRLERRREDIGVFGVERHRRTNLQHVVMRAICADEDPFVAKPVDDV
jgi:hypothetical protein